MHDANGSHRIVIVLELLVRVFTNASPMDFLISCIAINAQIAAADPIVIADHGAHRQVCPLTKPFGRNI